MSPKISVITTVRNGEPYIAEAVESILKQTYKDFEFIIIDDNSTDRSLPIVESFDDPRIKIIKLDQNFGRTQALNLGVKEAQGQYIAIHDADDISLPQRFEKQVDYLAKNPDTSLLCTRHCYIDSAGKILQEYAVPVSHASLCWKLASNNCISHSSVMLATEKLRALGGYDESFSYSHDYYLYRQLIQEGDKLASLPSYLTHIRVHPQSMFNSLDEERRIEESLCNSAAIMNYFLPHLPANTAKELNMLLRGLKPIRTLEELRQLIETLISLHTNFLNCFELQHDDFIFIDAALTQNLFELSQRSKMVKNFGKMEDENSHVKNIGRILKRIFGKPA